MQAQLKFVKGKRPADRDGKFAVDYESCRFETLKPLDDIGEIARQRLAGLRLQENLVPIPKGDAAKAVPFRLVLPIVAHRDFIDRACFHRREGRFEC